MKEANWGSEISQAKNSHALHIKMNKRDFNWSYIDNGRSILRLFFLANLTCFVILMHKSKSIVMHTKINARRKCLKYKETAEKTKKAKMTSSHITKITTSTLHQQMGRKKKGSKHYQNDK
ncbi:hypothetical protein PanWU01x14_151970 [Parasponia andersonii]|uniref:Transmembrane protein n=1 Tax=Parasponia andersonii TaxID=3476 RepID=A0A2P5CHX6_PARAD|nr:hypothetical protein PanWU01x14_151970 [Parasponia andersonii]